VITANDQEVWRAFGSKNDPGSKEVNPTDREWRFHDVDLSPALATGTTVKVGFYLASDPMVEGSGWNIDDVCLVALPAVCGNGIVDPGETCDDGNTKAGDGCSPSCQDEKPSGGCCGAGAHPAGPIALAAFVLVALGRRRRASRY
jgi:uncharacterized protein (TIGR03382 family)